MSGADVKKQLLSFVIPCYNEEESLELLYDGIISNIGDDYEIIFIDDGSTDRSREVIRALHAKDENVHLIAFGRNFGKAAALQAGFNSANGDIVITMDADLQDEPSEITHFVEKINEGYDVVSGWKIHRNDPMEKRLPSKLFNKVTSRLSGVKLHDFNCGFKAYRREVVRAISVYGERHRYIPVLAHQRGYRITEIAVSHNARPFGRSKYGAKRYLRGFFDLLSVAYLGKYYHKPMHFFGKLGLFSGFVGLAICVYMTALWVAGESIGNRPLLLLGVLLIMTGIQFFSIGIIGDILVDHGFKEHYHENHVRERF